MSSVIKLTDVDMNDGLQPTEPMPKKRGGMSGHLILPPEYPEVRLFALLKWKFGPPNGFISFLGRPGGDPDGPFKWDYVFRPVESLHVQVIRIVDGIEVRWWGTEAQEEDILDYLDHNLSIHEKEIDQTIGSLEEYTLILNPYVRHRSIAKLAEEELAKIQLKRPDAPPHVCLSKELCEGYGREFQNFLQLVDRQALFSMLLVIEAAFAAEAFLNLILAMCLRSEIRVSDNVREETLLRRWRAKIEHLPVDCHYIKGSPNMGDSRIRDAKRLFDLRNRVAHSYPDPKEMKLGTMWFLGSFPVLPQGVPFHEFAFALNNRLPSVGEAIDAKKSSEGLVAFLRELIVDEVRNEFDMFVEANPLGYNESKQMYGIPFGKFVILASGFRNGGADAQKIR